MSVRGLPLPPLGTFHPYAWACFVLTMTSVLLNAFSHAVGLSSAPSPLLWALAMDAWMLAFIPYVVAPLIGGHALVRFRWPGRTATERARRPQRRDVVLVCIALVLGAVNLVVLVRWTGRGF